MKLLSMKVGDDDRGGIVIGEEVLDFTAFRHAIGAGGIITQTPEWTVIVHPITDALGLYDFGLERLRETVSKISNEPDLAEKCRQMGCLLPLASVVLNPPVLRPGKILAVGLNYAAHAAEQNIKPPESPLIFSKNVTALIAAGEPIQLPHASERVDYEAELAFVIGREARSVSAADAFDYVAGYTIVNDVTARDLQAREKQWVRAKGLDTFAPCGPWLVTQDAIADPHALDISLRVNGELRQQSNTSDLIFKIPQLVEFISQDLTLRPGDIVSTGTPSGVGVFMDPPIYLQGGEQIDITIAGIGQLRNPVAGRAAR